MAKFRNTQARLAIEELILEAKKALSHHDILDELGSLCNRVTIYRVLARLEKEGIIHKMVDMDGVVKYASCNPSCPSTHSHSHTHVHFSCIVCHRVTCLDQVIPQFQLPAGYKMEEMNFTIAGVCPQCQ